VLRFTHFTNFRPDKQDTQRFGRSFFLPQVHISVASSETLRILLVGTMGKVLKEVCEVSDIKPLSRTVMMLVSTNIVIKRRTTRYVGDEKSIGLQTL
jgi:hypothetical protein